MRIPLISSPFPLVACLGAAFALKACGTVDQATVARLAALSPLEADPAGFGVQVEMPDGVRLTEDGTFLELSATGPDGVTIGDRFDLVPIAGVWRIDPDRLDELRDLQASVRALEDAAPDDTQGSLSVTVGACAETLPWPEDGRVSVWIALEPGAELRPLIRRTKLSDVVDAASVGQAPLCPEPAEG